MPSKAKDNSNKQIQEASHCNPLFFDVVQDGDEEPDIELHISQHRFI